MLLMIETKMRKSQLVNLFLIILTTKNYLDIRQRIKQQFYFENKSLQFSQAFNHFLYLEEEKN